MTMTKADEIAARLRMKIESLDFIDMRIAMIADAYRRQASNRDAAYRQVLMEKVSVWLEEITLYVEENPEAIVVLMNGESDEE
jgi:hypothetical protein